jgi:hypothetical protein
MVGEDARGGADPVTRPVAETTSPPIHQRTQFIRLGADTPSSQIGAMLEHAAWEGWELVSVVPGPPCTVLKRGALSFFWKRPHAA